MRIFHTAWKEEYVFICLFLYIFLFSFGMKVNPGGRKIIKPKVIENKIVKKIQTGFASMTIDFTELSIYIYIYSDYLLKHPFGSELPRRVPCIWNSIMRKYIREATKFIISWVLRSISKLKSTILRYRMTDDMGQQFTEGKTIINMVATFCTQAY